MFTACVSVCVSLSDRCVSQSQVGGRGSNSCPSPCRWQPAEQHQSLLGPNLSNSLSVHLAVSVAAAAAALTVSAGRFELDKPSSKSCHGSLVLSSLHLFSSSYCLGPPLSPSPLFSYLSLQPPLLPPLDAQLLGRGTYPLPGSRCCGGEVGSEAGGRVSVCLSLSRSRLWARTGRASLTSLYAVQPALPAGF